MWCFACCCFSQHLSSAHQDPWFFRYLRYSHFSKFSTFLSYRIRGPTCCCLPTVKTNIPVPQLRPVWWEKRRPKLVIDGKEFDRVIIWIRLSLICISNWAAGGCFSGGLNLRLIPKTMYFSGMTCSPCKRKDFHWAIVPSMFISHPLQGIMEVLNLSVEKAAFLLCFLNNNIESLF